MSRSNAAAIRRRVTNVQNNPPPTPSSVPPPAPVVQERPTGLTLQQFISNLDKRVVTLEESLRTTSSNDTNSDISALIDEFNSRFEMFATEIADMKDVILKLQSYTMDVNKMLLEERNSTQQSLRTVVWYKDLHTLRVVCHSQFKELVDTKWKAVNTS